VHDETQVAQRPVKRADGKMLEAISSEIVSLQSQFFGKGPTRARTTWAGPDVLVCLMGGGFTQVEKTLYNSGRVDAVMQMRRAFQDSMEGRLREVVEGVTGRHVVAFMSANHQEPDLIAEIFVFAPETDDPGHPLHG
jgi:uncharacterized protein YbcI